MQDMAAAVERLRVAWLAFGASVVALADMPSEEGDWRWVFRGSGCE